MKNHTILFITGILLTLTFIVKPEKANAQTTIQASDVGWYHSTGFSVGSSLNNYLVGDSDEINFVNVRNFLVFDLSSLTLPIQSASVQLFNGTQPPGYVSPDPFETYALFDVTTDIGVLTAGTGNTETYNDLAEGTFFGSVDITPADNGQFVEVKINAPGIAAMNSANGLFAFGGDITTISHPVTTEESAFRFSHQTPNVRLIVETIPEPSAMTLLLCTIISWGGRNRIQLAFLK